jgi:uncharacterized protein (DUF924 family)
MVPVAFANVLVQSFASKPFVQKALQNVHQPASVLSFWFGIDTSTTNGMEQLRTGSKECMTDMSFLWYNGGPDFDLLCQPFAEVVHLAGTNSLPSPSSNDDSIGNPWYTTVDGNIAQVIVIDQLARNVFRGTNDAFKYESVSLNVARQLSKQYLPNLDILMQPHVSNEPPIQLIDDISTTLYPPYCAVLATALMHSEQQYDHLLCQALLQHSISLAKDRHGSKPAGDENDDTDIKIQKSFEFQMTFAMDHKKVIDRFGRYPHRNRLLNRTSTSDEILWLSDTENLPGWAKSQG